LLAFLDDRLVNAMHSPLPNLKLQRIGGAAQSFLPSAREFWISFTPAMSCALVNPNCPARLIDISRFAEDC
jgi:hypothetical protein